MSKQETQEQIQQRSDEDRLTKAANAASSARRDSQREGSARSRPPVAGGMRLKLGVQGSLPGYHLYWENDQDGAIEQLLYEGFEFVNPSIDKELRLESAFVRDGDLNSRISRYVGRREDGSPLRAYLLKCPDEIWEDRESERYKQADAWDEAIRESVNGEGRYKTAGGVQINNKAAFRKVKEI